MGISAGVFIVVLADLPPILGLHALALAPATLRFHRRAGCGMRDMRNDAGMRRFPQLVAVCSLAAATSTEGKNTGREKMMKKDREEAGYPRTCGSQLTEDETAGNMLSFQPESKGKREQSEPQRRAPRLSSLSQ